MFRHCASRADHLVDDVADTETIEHTTHGGAIAEGEVAGAVWLAGTGSSQSGLDLLGRTQVALRHLPWFAVRSGQERVRPKLPGRAAGPATHADVRREARRSHGETLAVAVVGEGGRSFQAAAEGAPTG